jgi:hypothetical protein
MRPIVRTTIPKTSDGFIGLPPPFNIISSSHSKPLSGRRSHIVTSAMGQVNHKDAASARTGHRSGSLEVHSEEARAVLNYHYVTGGRIYNSRNDIERVE